MKKIKQGIRRVSIGTLGNTSNGKPIITEGRCYINMLEKFQQ